LTRHLVEASGGGIYKLMLGLMDIAALFSMWIGNAYF
jgi:hypothetical protein